MPTDPATAGQPTAFATFIQFVPLILIFFVIMWMSGSSQRKEKKKKEQLLNSLSKGQKVQTIGGIIGTVEEIREEEIVLLTDPRNKTTLTVAKASVSNAVA